MRRALCTNWSPAALSWALSASSFHARASSWKLWLIEVDEWYNQQQTDRCGEEETDEEEDVDNEGDRAPPLFGPLVTSSAGAGESCSPSSSSCSLAADELEVHEWFEEQRERDATRERQWAISLGFTLHAQRLRRSCCCLSSGAPD